jgi:hypothetical protein
MGYIFTGTLLLPVVVELVCAAVVVPRRVRSSVCAGVYRAAISTSCVISFR